MSKILRKTQPIQRFVRFFKHYGISLSLIVGSIPWLTSLTDTIPMFKGVQKSVLLITSLASYLLVAFIFSQRRNLAKIYFPSRITGKRSIITDEDLLNQKKLSYLPVVLLGITILLFFWYHNTLFGAVNQVAFNYSIGLDPTVYDEKVLNQDTSKKTQIIKTKFQTFGRNDVITVLIYPNSANNSSPQYTIYYSSRETVYSILDNLSFSSTPSFVLTSTLFLGAFLASASAFILMGLQEYLQEEMNLNDHDLLLDASSTQQIYFDVQNAPGIYGIIAYNRYDLAVDPIIDGPFCAEHHEMPEPKKVDQKTGKVKAWCHKENTGKEESIIECDFSGNLSYGELHDYFNLSAQKKIDQIFPNRSYENLET